MDFLTLKEYQQKNRESVIGKFVMKIIFSDNIE